MATLTDALETAERSITQRRPLSVDYYEVASARVVKHPTVKIRLEKVGGVTTISFLNGLVPVGASYKFSAILPYSLMIDKTSHATTTYGDVKQDWFWRQLYDVGPRALPYIEAGAATTKNVESVACMACGLVLPLNLITIDHQRPQTGGEIEAIVKVFRTLGLTVEGPKGPKGRMMQDHLFRGVGLGPVPTQPTRPALGGISLQNRYTLTEVGNVLLSLVESGNMLDELKRRCMNNPINLSPLCSHCNPARGNPVKFP